MLKLKDPLLKILIYLKIYLKRYKILRVWFRYSGGQFPVSGRLEDSGGLKAFRTANTEVTIRVRFVIVY